MDAIITLKCSMKLNFVGDINDTSECLVAKLRNVERSLSCTCLAYKTDVISFSAYFRRTEAKARRARSASRTREEEREKNTAFTHTVLQVVPALK